MTYGGGVCSKLFSLFRRKRSKLLSSTGLLHLILKKRQFSQLLIGTLVQDSWNLTFEKRIPVLTHSRVVLCLISYHFWEIKLGELDSSRYLQLPEGRNAWWKWHPLCHVKIKVVHHQPNQLWTPSGATFRWRANPYVIRRYFIVPNMLHVALITQAQQAIVELPIWTQWRLGRFLIPHLKPPRHAKGQFWIGLFVVFMSFIVDFFPPQSSHVLPTDLTKYRLSTAQNTFFNQPLITLLLKKKNASSW